MVLESSGYGVSSAAASFLLLLLVECYRDSYGDSMPLRRHTMVCIIIIIIIIIIIVIIIIIIIVIIIVIKSCSPGIVVMR
jgi:Flp pilus assembly protein TadB